MRWLDSLANLVFGGPVATTDDAGSPAAEAVPAVEEDRLWRPVTTAGEVDPPFGRLREVMLDAAEAYRANPLAFRVVELTCDHVLGKGVRVISAEPDVQAWIDRFWTHPENRMAVRVYDLCRELSLSGELFVTLHPNPVEQMTYLRAIPASQVDEIETAPDDVERELRFHQAGAGGEIEGRWWTPERCAHYAINRLPGAVRGQGDLTPILPWLRRYKDWLTDRVRINRFKGAFLWWVRLAGADALTVAAKRAELARPPEPGSVVVTNEAEEWRAVQPQIDAQAVEPDGRAMRLMVAAGAGIPLHFLAEATDTNRATAQEMGGPTLRHFEQRQLFFGWVLCDLVRRAAALAGAFPGRELNLRAVFEDLTTADNLRLAQASRAMVQALAGAADRGWIDDEHARAVLSRFLGVRSEGVAL